MAAPLYRQIAEDLRQQIESGALAPGDRVPSEIKLRERYSASRNTIRDAIKWLTSLGLVEIRLGQGTFVGSKIDPFVTTVSGDPAAGYRDWITVRTPDPVEAAFFNLPQTGQVAVFEILRTAFDQSGQPFRVTVTVGRPTATSSSWTSGRYRLRSISRRTTGHDP